MTFPPFLLASTCCPRIARVASSEELGTMFKNNLRRITLVRGPIWWIHSLTLIISWYQLEILAMQEFTASASSAELIEDRKRLEETAISRKAFLDNALKDAKDRMKNLLLEMGSAGMQTRRHHLSSPPLHPRD